MQSWEYSGYFSFDPLRWSSASEAKACSFILAAFQLPQGDGR